MSHRGPLVLIDGEIDDSDLELAARVAARFSQGRDAERVEVELTTADGATRRLEVTPMPAEQIPQEWYV